MALAEGQPNDQIGGRQAYGDVLRFYDRAKAAEWQVSDLPWQELPSVPEVKGSPKKLARRGDLWRSVLSQQLQADELACAMASQLLNAAPDPEAKLYYSTMVQDESRHTEAWLKLLNEVGDRTDRDPYLDELVRIVLEADNIEEKIFLMQVFFEKAIIGRFQEIEKSAGKTVLGKLCKLLRIDDGIHHGSGMAYERVLLPKASKKVKVAIADTSAVALPVFVKHALWRPRERAFIGSHMETQDKARVRQEVEEGIQRAHSLGLDFDRIEVPFRS